MASISHVANFGARFCNELNKDESCICSPYSVESVLAIIALSSSNESRAEIFSALDIANEDHLRSTFSSLNFEKQFLRNLVSKIPLLNLFKQDATFKVANKIYVKQGKALKPGLKVDAENIFKAGLELIDFTKSSKAAKSINDWVANQTNDIIKDIISEKVLDEKTRLVLVNAIYFHGFWKIQFDSRETYTGNFHVNNNKKIDQKFMTLDGKHSFNYMHSPELKARILQMFYVGDQASMVIVLPDEIEGLSEMLKRITSGYDLIADISNLQKTDLLIYIPKFKIESEINLKEMLPKMGIKTIFDNNKADINMLSSNDPLYVSEAIQKAFIRVDEKGTEAAAATGIMFIECCGRIYTCEKFVANRPFLFLLTADKIPIFYGTFYGEETPEIDPGNIVNSLFAISANALKGK